MATRGLTAGSLEGFALLAGAQRRPERAVQLWAAADALRGAIGTPRDQHERAQFEQTVAAHQEALGEEAFAAAWSLDAALPLDDAVTLALTDPTLSARSG